MCWDFYWKWLEFTYKFGQSGHNLVNYKVIDMFVWFRVFSSLWLYAVSSRIPNTEPSFVFAVQRPQDRVILETFPTQHVARSFLAACWSLHTPTFLYKPLYLIYKPRQIAASQLLSRCPRILSNEADFSFLPRITHFAFLYYYLFWSGVTSFVWLQNKKL